MNTRLIQRARVMAAASAALFFAATLPAAEPVLLQYKFQKDKPLRYVLNMKSRASFAMPDGTVENQNMTSKMELEQSLIDPLPDGDYKVAVTIVAAEQTVNGEARQIPVAEGHSQVITMKSNGEVIGEEAGEAPAASSQLQMVFPAKPVAEGEAWVQTSNITQPIPLETSTRYVLEKVDATYPGYGKTTLIKSSMGIENEKTPTGEQVHSTTEGNLWFDRERGCIVRSKAISSFKFDLPVNIPGVINSKVMVDLDLDIEIQLAELLQTGGESGGESGGGQQ